MKWVTKKYFLLTSSLYIFGFILLVIFNSTCYETEFCRVTLWTTIETLAPFALVFLFSLITYRMKIEVFRHWMGFAIWATPLLMLLTYLINGGGNNGLGVEGVIGGAFDALLLIVLYGLYCGISLWRIWSGWKH